MTAIVCIIRLNYRCRSKIIEFDCFSSICTYHVHAFLIRNNDSKTRQKQNEIPEFNSNGRKRITCGSTTNI